MKSSKRLIALGVVVSGVVLSLLGVSVSAIVFSPSVTISNNLPHPNNATSPSNIMLEVALPDNDGAMSSSLRAPTASIKAYFNSTTGRIEIPDFNHCKDPVGYGTNYDTNAIPIDRGDGDWDMSLRAYRLIETASGTSEVQIDLDPSTANLHVNNEVHIATSAADLASCMTPYVINTSIINGLVGSTGLGHDGLYPIRLQFTARYSLSGLVNAFRVISRNADGTAAIAAYDGTSYNPQFSLQNRGGVGAGNKFYRIPFAPDCTVTGTSPKILYWSDDDYNTAINPSGSPVVFSVYRAAYGSNDFQKIGISYRGNPPALDVVPTGGFQSAPPDAGTSATITVETGYRYVWEWRNVEDTNGVQFQVPFDGIYFNNPCPGGDWSLAGSSGGTGIALPGQTITWNHSIRNEGPDATTASVAINVQRSFTGSGGPYANTNSYTMASGRAVGAANQYNLPAQTYLVTAADVGRVICERVQFTPEVAVGGVTSGTGTSTGACYTIATLPRMSIVGGDAISGGSVGCAATPGGFEGASGALPGSFGEYALIIAPGSITNFGSMARPNFNGLKIANNPTVSSYTPTRCITDLASRITNGLTLTDIAGGSGALPAAGDYRITGDYTFAETTGITGQRILYAPGRIVTIDGNIEYSAGPFASFADAPSVTIIADRIRINPGVSRIDATLIGTTSVTTCSATGDSPLSNVAAMAATGPAGVCRTAPPLVINGAVYTGHFMATRTAGGGSPAEAPAEIIRYRPDSFLGPYERSRSNSILKTDSEIELPARN